MIVCYRGHSKQIPKWCWKDSSKDVKISGQKYAEKITICIVSKYISRDYKRKTSHLQWKTRQMPPYLNDQSNITSNKSYWHHDLLTWCTEMGTSLSKRAFLMPFSRTGLKCSTKEAQVLQADKGTGMSIQAPGLLCQCHCKDAHLYFLLKKSFILRL